MAVALQAEQPEALAVGRCVAVDERRRVGVTGAGALQLPEPHQDRQVPAGAVQPGAQQARRHEVAVAGALAVEQGPADAAGERHPGDVIAEPAADRRRHDTWRDDRRGKRRASPEGADVVAGAVGVGTVEAVAGDDPVDDRRVPLAHGSRPESEPLEGGDAHVRDEHVGPLEQSLHRLLPGLAAQIEHDAALAPVVQLERRHRRLLTGADGTEDRPLRVAGRRLDLDDVGAPVGEDARRRRTGHPGRQLDHADTVEDHGPDTTSRPRRVRGSWRTVIAWPTALSTPTCWTAPPPSRS